MASAKVIEMKPKTKPAQLLCSGCGVTQDAACDCGMAYLPAAKAAAKAVARNPEKSNRAIAADLGVDESTVRQARKQVRDNSAPEPRVGRDGKTYKAPTKREPPSPEIVEMALAQQRLVAKVLLREVSRNVDEAATRILEFSDRYPSMEEETRKALADLLATSIARLTDADRKFNSV